MRPLRIVQISTIDIGGGAENIAWSLHNAYRTMGHKSLLVVGKKLSDDPDVFAVDDDTHSKSIRFGLRALEALTGWQSLAHLKSRKLPKLVVDNFDIIHGHNLHSAYINLSVFRKLSKRLPIILTLHDHWLLTGHCAHPFNCERWLTGCGRCPDLSIYPHVRRDGTRFNWRYKRRVVSDSNPYIATPSRWLADRVDKSFLANAPKQVIYNGVDTDIFSPGNPNEARQRLGLGANAKIILFIANNGLDSPWKDPSTLLKSFSLLRDKMGRHNDQPLLLVVGQEKPPSPIPSDSNIVFRPHSTNARETADYYRAADVLAYTSIADNCPLVVLEALACGLPIVASAVGGIPELIDDGKTGLLAGQGNAQEFSRALRSVLDHRQTQEKMATAARLSALSRFDLGLMAEAYLMLYKQALGAS
ncbi:MAG: glycosyltransferase [Actinomycetota bacterium]|nr:glycosyltransferase [Actinomycetota bacterium]